MLEHISGTVDFQRPHTHVRSQIELRTVPGWKGPLSVRILCVCAPCIAINGARYRRYQLAAWLAGVFARPSHVPGRSAGLLGRIYYLMATHSLLRLSLRGSTDRQSGSGFAAGRPADDGFLPRPSQDLRRDRDRSEIGTGRPVCLGGASPAWRRPWHHCLLNGSKSSRAGPANYALSCYFRSGDHLRTPVRVHAPRRATQAVALASPLSTLT